LERLVIVVVKTPFSLEFSRIVILPVLAVVPEKLVTIPDGEVIVPFTVTSEREVFPDFLELVLQSRLD
jgi:hypothetical protein